MAPRRKSVTQRQHQPQTKKTEPARVESEAHQNNQDSDDATSRNSDQNSGEAVCYENSALHAISKQLESSSRVLQTNREASESFMKEVDDCQATMLERIAEEKQHIETNWAGYADIIKPILTAALFSLSEEQSTTTDPIIRASQILEENAELYKQCSAFLVQSSVLKELHDAVVGNERPETRASKLRAGLDDDKAAVAVCIQAGKKVTGAAIRRQLFMLDGVDPLSEKTAEHEERKGHLLVQWGKEAQDTDAVHQSQFAKLTKEMTKIVSKLERIAQR